MMSEPKLSERISEDILGPLRDLRKYIGKVLLKQFRSSMPSQVIRAFDHLDIRISEAMKEAAALEAKLERMDTVLKELADLCNDGEPHDLGGPHISIPWVLNRFAAEDDLSKLTTQQKPTKEAMEEA